MSGLSRRELLELTAAVAAVGTLPRALADAPAAPRDASRPRNIVFMVSDGMSLGVPSMAEAFSRRARDGAGTHWHALLRDPAAARGFFVTSSLSSLVTDSAAASSAWGSGTQVFNGAINVLPDGTKLTPLARLARETGRRIGLTTTTTITHATPAGFAAVQPRRDDEEQIAAQYLEQVDVLLGGGRSFFEPKHRSDKRDLLSEYKAAGYTLWDDRQAVETARPERVLGLFASGHLPFSIDQRNVAELVAKTPPLATMASAALDILGRSEHGFLLQIEGGRVDHAAHANDAAAQMWDQLAFDDALGVVLDFARRRGDTLVIVTADHGNSNPGLNGMGGEYRDSTACFERLTKAMSSFERLAPRLGDGPVEDLIDKQLGVTLSAREADAVQAAVGGHFDGVLNLQHAKLVGVLGEVLANHVGVGWTGTNHTQDWVLLTAIGPGSERFADLIPLTAGFERIAELWGISHRNPKMTADDARRYLAAAPPIERPHWI